MLKIYVIITTHQVSRRGIMAELVNRLLVGGVITAGIAGTANYLSSSKCFKQAEVHVETAASSSVEQRINDSTPAKPFNFGTQGGTPSVDVCTKYPELDQWASQRNLDPMLVRAFALTESGLDPDAAAKACSKQCIDTDCTSGCFPADLSGNSEGYSNGYDMMVKPVETQNSPIPLYNSPDTPPAWRWSAFGIMQGVEPPYTFWPDNHLSAADVAANANPFQQVFINSARNQKAFSTDTNNDFTLAELDIARSCNPHFNPFHVGDSACIGTYKMAQMLKYGHQWIQNNKVLLGFSDGGVDSKRSNVFAAYIAAEMYSGLWLSGSSSRSVESLNAFPTCPSSISNGMCWAYAYAASREVTTATCSTGADKDDKTKCQDGKPRWAPPYYCFGATDIISYINQCWFDINHPFTYKAQDPGTVKMQAYYWLSNGCANSIRPDGKKLMDK